MDKLLESLLVAPREEIGFSSTRSAPQVLFKSFDDSGLEDGPLLFGNKKSEDFLAFALAFCLL